MSIASRINEITNHLTDDWQSIQNIGGDTSIDNNIENISQALEDLYDEMPKVSSSGTNLSLNDTRKGRLSLDLKGNTSQKILPSEYTAVDYIESSGTQYIDTGFKPNQNTRMTANIDILSTIGYTNVGGARDGNTNQFHIIITPGNYFDARYSSSSKGVTTTLIGKHNFDFNKNTLIIDDGTYIFTSTTFQSQYNAYIFAVNNAGSATQNANYKLYNMEWYDNGTLIRDYIPCYRNSDNEVGLYDLVNDTFYTNQGTGVFTYGTTSSIPNPDIPIPINVVSGDNSINVCGKNLLNMYNSNEGVVSNITLEIGLNSFKGTATNNFAYGSRYISGLEIGDTYTISFNAVKDSNATNGKIYIGNDTTGNIGQYFSQEITTTLTNYSFTFTASTNI